MFDNNGKDNGLINIVQYQYKYIFFIEKINLFSRKSVILVCYLQIDLLFWYNPLDIIGRILWNCLNWAEVRKLR